MILNPIAEFFINHTYVAIFPAAIFEGPIVTIISGVLVSLNHLSFIPALLVVFIADVISDSVFYMIGKGGRYIMPYITFIRVSDEHLQRLENQFHTSPWKTMILAKVSYGLGAMFMVASGASRMTWRRFLGYMLSLNFIRSLVLLVTGFYFGRAALRLGSTYIRYYTVAVIIIIPTVYVLYRKIVHRYAYNETK